MATLEQPRIDAPAPRGYRDLREHIAALDGAGLLQRIDRAIDKDSEMHPLVRWQYRGGIPDERRKAFLFTNVVDASGRRYEHPVLVAGLAGSRAIYATGMNCALDAVGARWTQALGAPIPPVLVADAPVHEVVLRGDALAGRGLLDIPVPISTPGFDNAPFLSSAHYITRDPETGVRNCGNYRGQIKGATTLGIYYVPFGNDAQVHAAKARARGEHLPVAIVVGAPPVVSYAAVQRMPIDLDEFAVAGALAGAPIRMVRCVSVDLDVPADSELVIEGYLRTDVLEPEGPFGESHGFVNPRSQSPIVEVTAITHRRDYIMTSFISQVTPSESSTIKRVAYEPMFERFLRDECEVRSLVKVSMHEPLTNIRPVIFLQFRKPKDGEVWRALKLASSYKVGVGKLVIAVDEDIDPTNLDAVLWALAYRMVPHRDVQIVRGYDKAHAPPFRRVPAEDNSVMLIDATLREPFPPVSLPAKPYMERARAIWDELGLGPLQPEPPWHGYLLGPWPAEYEEEARLATEGRWLETVAKLAAQRTPVDD